MLILSLSLASSVRLSTIRRMPSAGSMASIEKARLAVSRRRPKAPNLNKARLFSLILQQCMRRLSTATNCSWFDLKSSRNRWIMPNRISSPPYSRTAPAIANSTSGSCDSSLSSSNSLIIGSVASPSTPC
uniref:Ubiquitin-protein ligase n=1 Tax=Rhizophora mucronata TaxID=61149 RepID=A0A2P2KZW9_RHIMU